MVVTAAAAPHTAAPPLPDELAALRRRMRLPYLRNAAPTSSRSPARSVGTRPRPCACCSPGKSAADPR